MFNGLMVLVVLMCSLFAQFANVYYFFYVMEIFEIPCTYTKLQSAASSKPL